MPSRSLGEYLVHIGVSPPLSPLRNRSTAVLLSIMERQWNEPSIPNHLIMGSCKTSVPLACLADSCRCHYVGLLRPAEGYAVGWPLS
jgi:hypothetical protein